MLNELEEKGLIDRYAMGGGIAALFYVEPFLTEEIPIPFIPAYNALVGEAVEEAVEVKYKRVKTKVLRAEHLFAIMLQTDRPKDRSEDDGIS